jgi:hypothetical protein
MDRRKGALSAGRRRRQELKRDKVYISKHRKCPSSALFACMEDVLEFNRSR